MSSTPLVAVARQRASFVDVLAWVSFRVVIPLLTPCVGAAVFQLIPNRPPYAALFANSILLVYALGLAGRLLHTLYRKQMFQRQLAMLTTLLMGFLFAAILILQTVGWTRVLMGGQSPSLSVPTDLRVLFEAAAALIVLLYVAITEHHLEL